MQSEHNPARVVWACRNCRGLAPHLAGEAGLASSAGDWPCGKIIRTEELPAEEQETFRLLDQGRTVERLSSDTLAGFALDTMIHFLEMTPPTGQPAFIPLDTVKEVKIRFIVEVDGMTILHLYRNYPPPGDD